MAGEVEKYYTPTIEEFHVGFEYEIMDESNGQYGSFIIKTQSDLVHATAFADYQEPRVKYLDKDDIEDLGFAVEHSPLAPDNIIYKRGEGGFNRYVNSNFTMQHYTSQDRLVIASPLSIIFNGTIKNKSELKRLLKQLNIK